VVYALKGSKSFCTSSRGSGHKLSAYCWVPECSYAERLLVEILRCAVTFEWMSTQLILTTTPISAWRSRPPGNTSHGIWTLSRRWNSPGLHHRLISLYVYRQRPSNDDCPAEGYQNCSVLCCVWHVVHSDTYTHLKVDCWFRLTSLDLYVCFLFFLSLPHAVNCIRFCFWRCDFFVCVWNTSQTAERICTRFTWKTCLVPLSDNFECQGQRSKVKGQGRTRDKKTEFSSPVLSGR